MSGSNLLAQRDSLTLPALIDEIKAGSVRAVSRAITMLENDAAEKVALLQALSPVQHHSIIIGITGYPGAGKSTLIDQLIAAYRSQGKTVGVLAVDISSSVTGGALLGDRIRMQTHSMNKGVYIRSMGTRGHRGGLAFATKDAIYVLEAAGFDVILVETIGTGQEEIDIAQCVHTVILVVTPGLGDEVQAMKAGILELAHIVVVNKADHPDVHKTMQALRDWVPNVMPVIATKGEGISGLIEAIDVRQKRYEVDSLKSSNIGER